MNIRKVSYSLALVAMFAFAGTAAAQGGPVENADTTYSALEVSANFQTALQLTIAQSGAGVEPLGSGAAGYTLDLGNVNGLGLGTPATGVTATALAANAGYLYTTPITLTPAFSGFTVSVASIKVEQASSDTDAAKAAIREGSSVLAAGTVQLVGGAGAMFTSGATNGTDITRFIGVSVPNSNDSDAADHGERTINLVYTISVDETP